MESNSMMETQSGMSLEPAPTKCSRCMKCTRQVTSFLLSHIGLLSLVVGYCIMGAFIFEELERENELETKRNMKKSRLAMSDTIWDITRNMEVLHETNWTYQVTESLKKFEKSLIIALKEKGWDGKEEEETVTWSFAGALFYSITVITTIGYGHIAPKTPVGKIVTIFYAILGIPITVVCWSNIGDAMAKAFRFTYWKICCYAYTKKTNKRRRRMLSRHRALSMRHPPSMVRRKSVRSRIQRPSQKSSDIKVPPSTVDMKPTTTLTVEKASDIEIKEGSLPQQDIRPQSLPTQLSETSMTQGRANDEYESIKKVPKTGEKMKEVSEKAGERMKEVSDKVLHKIRTAKKSANLSLDFDPKKLDKIEVTKNSPDAENASNFLQENARAKAILKAEKDSQKSQYSAASGTSNNIPGQPNSLVPLIASRGQRVARVIDEYDDQSYYEEFYYAESEDDLDEVSKRPVPIFLSVLLVVSYIVGGAFLFQMWEGWSFLDSAYFCFITLTTIGFGDFTPDQKNVDGEQRIALCSIYLLFGIAMIAMSFNLLQEEVINSVKGVGRMLGIVKDNDEEEEY